jgi:sugar phosphate isomerase/epimerase
MSRPEDRRRFLGKAASLAGAAVGLASLPAGAIEPLVRNGASKFKFSLAAYSYRSLLSGEKPKLKLDDFIRDCADMQLEATELTSYYFPKEITPEYLRGLKQLCFHLGLDVSGTAVRNDFALPPGEERQSDIDHVKRWVDYSEILGAPVIRVFAGHVQKGSSEAEAHKRIVAGMEECCDYAGQHGVHLALENHGGPTSTADGLLAIVRDVKSPWFGVNLDTGNFHTEDIYGDLERVAPYAMNVQIKVVVSGLDEKKQPADFPRLAEILRQVAYRGYVVLEHEERGNPRESCPTLVDRMRSAFS